MCIRDSYQSFQVCMQVSLRGRAGSVRFSPDGKYIAAGCTDSSVKILDVTKGLIIKEFTDVHQETVNDVRFSQSGFYMASGSSDFTVNLYVVPEFTMTNL
eukprot:TRINITY_DN1078_c0_g1_i5.p1 TRINITY_DN1078_c0_g1~~TRINITY_DN1078_c0_g1_i5.p1  ORF type:complete len:100 (-),score=5.77 TRINITY_DN1078_c0_g1_i5:2-301(-)